MESFNFVKNKQHGYFEVIPKPSQKYLEDYYAKKYYQNESANYRHSYSQDELKYFNVKISQKEKVINKLIHKNEKLSLLDVGCGEGFTLDYFNRKNWDVLGVDYSDFGIQQMNPHLIDKLRKGDIWITLNEIQHSGKKYDVIWLDNVLEHVINPEELLFSFKNIIAENGLLVIEVPNDFSAFQLFLNNASLISREYWKAFPDHLTYFSRSSLISLCEFTGWTERKVIGDFPIEWYLLNNHSNYVNDKTTGKQAHQSRILFENFLNDSVDNDEDLLNFYENLSKLNLGRQIIGFFQNK